MIERFLSETENWAWNKSIVFCGQDLGKRHACLTSGYSEKPQSLNADGEEPGGEQGEGGPMKTCGMQINKLLLQFKGVWLWLAVKKEGTSAWVKSQ